MGTFPHELCTYIDFTESHSVFKTALEVCLGNVHQSLNFYSQSKMSYIILSQLSKEAHINQMKMKLDILLAFKFNISSTLNFKFHHKGNTKGQTSIYNSNKNAGLTSKQISYMHCYSCGLIKRKNRRTVCV